MDLVAGYFVLFILMIRQPSGSTPSSVSAASEVYQRPKQRIIQEFVPGKQVTIAHVIANPKPDLFRKMGLEEKGRNAIGILTITPGEGTIIAADIASKSGDIEIGFIDRFSGALLITGDVSAVESALQSVIEGLQRILGFFPTDLTRS